MVVRVMNAKGVQKLNERSKDPREHDTEYATISGINSHRNVSSMRGRTVNGQIALRRMYLCPTVKSRCPNRICRSITLPGHVGEYTRLRDHPPHQNQIK